jgi:nucleoside-diphosphate-sugar epimerase
MAATNNDLVLLTGATGFLGFKILIDLLKAGYHVRVAVRSEKKLQKILATPSLKALQPSKQQLSSVIVPDLSVKGAYDEAVRNVKYVIHTASPIPTFGGDDAPEQSQLEDYFVKPAVAGAVGMLESANKAGTVKRVVITSSVVAIVPFKYYMGDTDDRVFNADDRIPTAEGPYGFEFEAYSASKAAALNETEAYISKVKPSFDLISIIPGWIFGRDELITDVRDLKAGSTNSVLVGLLLGGKNEVGYNGNSALGDDVAKVHVLALRPDVTGNQAFATSLPMKWESAHQVLKESFADAVADGRLSIEGKQPSIDIHVDSSKTEETFNLELAGFGRQVKEVAAQYLDLLG